jgi:hypothetical protein
LVKPARSFDQAAAELWVAILRECHRIVLSSSNVARLRGWWAKLRDRADRHPLPAFLPAVEACLVNRAKRTWVTEECAPEEACIRHPKDAFLARIAVRCPGCVIVTTDTQTREDFQRPEFSEKYGIRAVTVEEALALARAPN